MYSTFCYGLLHTLCDLSTRICEIAKFWNFLLIVEWDIPECNQAYPKTTVKFLEKLFEVVATASHRRRYFWLWSWTWVLPTAELLDTLCDFERESCLYQIYFSVGRQSKNCNPECWRTVCLRLCRKTKNSYWVDDARINQSEWFLCWKSDFHSISVQSMTSLYLTTTWKSIPMICSWLLGKFFKGVSGGSWPRLQKIFMKMQNK